MPSLSRSHRERDHRRRSRRLLDGAQIKDTSQAGKPSSRQAGWTREVRTLKREKNERAHLRYCCRLCHCCCYCWGWRKRVSSEMGVSGVVWGQAVASYRFWSPAIPLLFPLPSMCSTNRGTKGANFATTSTAPNTVVAVVAALSWKVKGKVNIPLRYCWSSSMVKGPKTSTDSSEAKKEEIQQKNEWSDEMSGNEGWFYDLHSDWSRYYWFIL